MSPSGSENKLAAGINRTGPTRQHNTEGLKAQAELKKRWGKIWKNTLKMSTKCHCIKFYRCGKIWNNTIALQLSRERIWCHKQGVKYPFLAKCSLWSMQGMPKGIQGSCFWGFCPSCSTLYGECWPSVLSVGVNIARITAAFKNHRNFSPHCRNAGKQGSTGKNNNHLENWKLSTNMIFQRLQWLFPTKTNNQTEFKLIKWNCWTNKFFLFALSLLSGEHLESVSGLSIGHRSTIICSSPMFHASLHGLRS